MRQLGDSQEGLLLRTLMLLVKELGSRAPDIAWNRHDKRTGESPGTWKVKSWQIFTKTKRKNGNMRKQITKERKQWDIQHKPKTSGAGVCLVWSLGDRQRVTWHCTCLKFSPEVSWEIDILGFPLLLFRVFFCSLYPQLKKIASSR